MSRQHCRSSINFQRNAESRGEIVFFHSTSNGKRAVAYYRHSAEDKQENSVPLQRDLAHQFALKNNIEIIHEEADEGKSGLLGPEARPGFKRLFENWIENPKAPHFDLVLTRHEDRWGRFQNPNEASYHEYRCNKQGKRVVYIESGIPEEGQEFGYNLAHNVKQQMAAEKSRQLSREVFRGCMNIAKQGFSTGGIACYGMARLLLDIEKKPVGVLKKREHKAISNARVTFTPANDETTEAVKKIFDLFATEEKTLHSIAEHLNSKKIPAPNGKTWNEGKILRILKNETYIGTLNYNKTSGKLKQRKRNNPRSEWVIVQNAFPNIIKKEVFYRTQELISLIKRKIKQSNNIKRVHRFVKKELQSYFLDNKQIDEDDVFIALREFPIVYSVPYSHSQSKTSFWCFISKHKLHRYKNIIGISISKDARNPIDKVFVIPTDEFGDMNFHIFSENDEEYSRYYVESDKVEKVFHDMTLQVQQSINSTLV